MRIRIIPLSLSFLTWVSFISQYYHSNICLVFFIFYFYFVLLNIWVNFEMLGASRSRWETYFQWRNFPIILNIIVVEWAKMSISSKLATCINFLTINVIKKFSNQMLWRNYLQLILITFLILFVKKNKKIKISYSLWRRLSLHN